MANNTDYDKKAVYPHPEIDWVGDSEPFLKHHDAHYIELTNEFTFKSATIRGDRSVTLNLMKTDSAETSGTSRGDFSVEKHNKHMIRVLPLDPSIARGGRKDGLYLQLTDSISREVNIPFDLRTNAPRQSKQEPLCWDGFRLVWQRDVGVGGFGLASLYDVHFDDGHHQRVVIKTPLRHGKKDAFKDERRWAERYHGAKNVVQSIDLAQLAKKHGKGPAGKWTKLSGGPWTDKGTLVLEYMEHDTLAQINHSLAYVAQYKPRVEWPQASLWLLFANLVKGIAEIAWSDGFYVAKDGALVDFNKIFQRCKKLSKESREKVWEQLAQWPVQHDVHFDMEEYNILCGRGEDGGITFKLHDFCDDHSKMMNEEWKHWRQENYVCRRDPCKPGRNLPEQHDNEWDGIVISRLLPDNHLRFTGQDFRSECQCSIPHPQQPDKPGCQANKTHTAGRYGMWSNIFTIGKLLECCITGNQYTHPFQDKMGHIDGKFQPHSYAWRLFDNIPSGAAYSSLDPDFLAMVAACQRQRPEERPSLINLLQKVFEAEQAGRMAPSEETKDFWYAALDPKGYVSGGSALPPKPNQPFSFDADNNDEEAIHPESQKPNVQQAKPAGKRFAVTTSSPSTDKPQFATAMQDQPAKSPSARPPRASQRGSPSLPSSDESDGVELSTNNDDTANSAEVAISQQVAENRASPSASPGRLAQPADEEAEALERQAREEALETRDLVADREFGRRFGDNRGQKRKQALRGIYLPERTSIRRKPNTSYAAAIPQFLGQFIWPRISIFTRPADPEPKDRVFKHRVDGEAFTTTRKPPKHRDVEAIQRALSLFPRPDEIAESAANPQPWSLEHLQRRTGYTDAMERQKELAAADPNPVPTSLEDLQARTGYSSAKKRQRELLISGELGNPEWTTVESPPGRTGITNAMAAHKLFSSGSSDESMRWKRGNKRRRP